MKNLRLFCLAVAVAMAISGAQVGISQSSMGGRVTSGPVNPETSARPQLAILDTDIGDDIDDAFALALALESPELKILGVTTAFGDTELRARLVDRYLAAVGRSDIPVLQGVTTKAANVFTQAAYAHQSPPRRHAGAVQFLLDQIHEHPGQITLIAIGPLTNIEAAIKRDPVTFGKLKRVVMMGGSVYRGYGGTAAAPTPPQPEWNILCDPAGAKALLASGVPVFMMPLDSTQVPLELDERERIFAHGSPLTDQLTLLYHQWMAGNSNHPVTPTLYDPVAVTYAIRPDLCPMTPLRLEVGNDGSTQVAKGEPNAQVCLKSDEAGFLKLLLDRLTKEDGAH